jgi:hypothetical protein
MRKITPALTGLAAAALTVGMAGPALAAIHVRALERVPAQAAWTTRPGKRSAGLAAVFTLRQLQTGHVHPG